MASALDKYLNEYKSRPKDESGARKNKISLIYDPKEASFIDADTFFQIGYQGFSKLCSIDSRFSDYGSSIFSYNNIQIDPLFLTAAENQSIFEKVESLLYLLCDYIMRPEAVQVLEYLIQQFAVPRLRPAHLVLTCLPYLETSFFVRVIQTISFKNLAHEFKFLKEFSIVSESKKPINRKVLRDMIEKRRELLHWIIKYSRFFTEVHPQGTFASFVGVLFTELGLYSQEENILRPIIDTCKASFSSENKSLAPHILMSVAAIHEKMTLHADYIDEFARLIFESPELLESHFRAIVMAAVYFGSHSSVDPNCEFIKKMGFSISEFDEITKQYKLKAFAEKCAKVIAANLGNEDLVRSSIALLETDFFADVATYFLQEVSRNYVSSEYSENLVQAIASSYPDSITSDIIERLNGINITIKPSKISPRNLINQLSNPKFAASLYSNPELPIGIASSQVVTALSTAETAENTDPISPILNYFSGRPTKELIRYLADHLLVNHTKFSKALNLALAEVGSGIAPFCEGLPKTNSAILEHLSKCDLPEGVISLPFALAKAKYHKDVIDALKLLPIKKELDFTQIIEKAKESKISVSTAESKAATILHIVEEVADVEDLSAEAISLLLNFPDIRCVAPILKKVKTQSNIFAAFEKAAYLSKSSPASKRICVNYLYYANAVCPKIEDPGLILPTIFIALLTDYLVDQATFTLRSIPLKNKDVNILLKYVLRQSQLFKSDEKSLCSVFNTASKNPKSREFFDKLWHNIQTPEGCTLFWRLTHDIGVFQVIKKYEDSPKIEEILTPILQEFPDNEEIKEWAFASLRPGLMRAAIPFLAFTSIGNIIPVVCAYPKYFSEAFTSFFQSQEIDAKDLIPFLKETPAKLLPQSNSADIPEKFKSLRMKSKYVISPSNLVLELIPISKNVTNVGAILPALFGILKSYKSHNLIFPILGMCVKTSADYMIKNFDIIVDTLSHSPIPNIHSSALTLVKTLASRDPTAIAKHTTSLFSVLTGSTLFVDDTVNLVKIKQLLSSVLPVLSKTNNIEALLDYFSDNIENFSVERASQLMVHSINVLNDDSFKVFSALLKKKKIEFALLLVDQMQPEPLMTALIKLLQTSQDEIVVEFVTQITLPALPKQLQQLFSILEQKIDISKFIESTLESLSLSDFVSVIVAFLPSNISIYNYFHKRVVAEQSPQFVALLDPLKRELSEFKSLDTNLSILAEVAPCLTTEQATQLISVIKLIIKGVEGGNYTVSNRVQALCFMASAIERFNLTLLEGFPEVISFAVSLYSKIVSEQIEAFIAMTTASVCLLMKTSVNLCMGDIPQLWTLMISPAVIDGDLYEMVENSLINTTKVASISELLTAFIVTYKPHKQHAKSLTLLFTALSNCLKFSDTSAFKNSVLLDRLTKFFKLAFGIQFADWDTNTNVQDSIITSFCIFLTQLDLPQLTKTMQDVIDFFRQFMVKEQRDYMMSRILFARIMTKVSGGLEKTLDRFYESLLQITLDTLLAETDDSDFLSQRLTAESLELFQNIAKYCPENVFDPNIFSHSLTVISKHAEVVRETDEEFITKIVMNVAPALAALLETTKKEDSWRAFIRVMETLMRSEDERVNVAGLQITDEAFKALGAEFTVVLRDILPPIVELIESSRGAEQVARQTLLNIESSIGEDINNYMN